MGRSLSEVVSQGGGSLLFGAVGNSVFLFFAFVYCVFRIYDVYDFIYDLCIYIIFFNYYLLLILYNI